MVNKLSQTIIDFNKLDKKNIKTIKIGDEIIGPDENGQVILNGTSGGGSTGGNTTGGSTGGNTTGGTTGGGTAPSQVAQLPSTVNLFSGSAVGNILLSGPSTNYDNVQDGLLITLSNLSSKVLDTEISSNYGLSTQIEDFRIDLSPSGLKTIKIPKEKLVVNSSIDISDQLSQYVGKMIQVQYTDSGTNWYNIDSKYSFGILSFGGATINVLPNTTLNINLTVNVSGFHNDDKFSIPVICVNTYKN